MLPLHWLTGLFLVAAGAGFALPAGAGIVYWSLLAAGFVGLCAWGSVAQDAPVLGRCVRRVEGTDRVALTFDDGPGEPATAAILDLLASRGVPATFFCVGRQVERHPELVRRMHAEGHGIGNHSYQHSPLATLAGTGATAEDLQRCQAAIRAVTGQAPRFFRPPFGVRTHATDPAARRQQLRVIGWDAGGGDTGNRSAEAVLTRIGRRLRGGSIVLLHDRVRDGERAVEITRRVLDLIERRGLVPVRLDVLLGDLLGD